MKEEVPHEDIPKNALYGGNYENLDTRKTALTGLLFNKADSFLSGDEANQNEVDRYNFIATSVSEGDFNSALTAIEDDRISWLKNEEGNVDHHIDNWGDDDRHLSTNITELYRDTANIEPVSFEDSLSVLGELHYKSFDMYNDGEIASQERTLDEEEAYLDDMSQNALKEDQEGLDALTNIMDFVEEKIDILNKYCRANEDESHEAGEKLDKLRLLHGTVFSEIGKRLGTETKQELPQSTNQPQKEESLEDGDIGDFDGGE